MHLFNLIEIEIVLVESMHFVSEHDCEFRFFAGLHFKILWMIRGGWF